jgi:haloalkane dehalogenase
VSSAQRYGKKRTRVDGYEMACVDEGEGDPILFLHGNPTSSYLWRNVMPHAEGLGRLVAPDLIGMGDSEKLRDSGPDRYTFAEHYGFLSALLDRLGVHERVTLVIHDWGSALGFHWANQHREAVRGIAYMESIVMPVTWDQWPNAVTPVFQGFRSAKGEAMVLDRNTFVEQVLPGAIARKLDAEEMAEYRRPFEKPGEDRRPTLTWPRQIPIEGEPADVARLVTGYGQWLAGSAVPKLFVDADPGAILRGPARDFCRSWPNQTEVRVKGIHFVQEDSPDAIGSAVANFVRGLP